MYVKVQAIVLVPWQFDFYVQERRFSVNGDLVEVAYAGD